MKYSRIVGWGKYVPRRVLTNRHLERMVDTSDEWIVKRTGIRERRIAAAHETTSSMSLAAARRALEVARLDPAELDLIILATASPDYQVPGAANIVQHRLGASRAAAFDLRAGCTGFVYALVVGSQFIATGAYRNVLVIGAEMISKFVNWEDRTTCVLFGDGAGAVVLQESDAPTGLLSFVLGSDGSGYDALIVPGGGSSLPFCQEVLDKGLHHIKMDGKRVFRFAVKTPAEAAQKAIEACGLSVEDIDLLIPHQANLRIIRSLAETLGLPWEKVYVNLDRYGNTSAASIPIALCEAVEEGKVREGDNVVLVGFGAGLTWATAVVRWGVPVAFSEVFPWRWPLSREATFERVRAAARGAMGAILSVVGALLLPFYSGTDKGESRSKKSSERGDIPCDE